MGKRVGGFNIDVWTGGAPIWVVLKYDGFGDEVRMQFRSEKLHDLKYAVEMAMRAAAHQPDAP